MSSEKSLYKHRYIAIEGPIGAGKTSLAKRLAASYGGKTLLECPDENPFLERFYQSRGQFALPTQLYFLFQRARQLEELRQADLFQDSIVSDFMLDKDRLFARVNLDDQELHLYDQVYENLSLDLPIPDLVIYLQASEDVLMERIRRRNLPYERAIERKYLQDLAQAYAQFFYHYNASPLLVINVENINIVDNVEDYQTLLAYISQARTGRHFFNPLTT